MPVPAAQKMVVGNTRESNNKGCPPTTVFPAGPSHTHWRAFSHCMTRKEGVWCAWVIDAGSSPIPAPGTCPPAGRIAGSDSPKSQAPRCVAGAMWQADTSFSVHRRHRATGRRSWDEHVSRHDVVRRGWVGEERASDRGPPQFGQPRFGKGERGARANQQQCLPLGAEPLSAGALRSRRGRQGCRCRPMWRR